MGFLPLGCGPTGAGSLQSTTHEREDPACLPGLGRHSAPVQRAVVFSGRPDKAGALMIAEERLSGDSIGRQYLVKTGSSR